MFADASEDLIDVGKSIEVVALHGQRRVVRHYTILATRRGDAAHRRIRRVLCSNPNGCAAVRKESQRIEGLRRSSSDVSQIPVSASPRQDEQRKIAACLTSLDEWIAAEGRKLEALRAHKKGLMQQLFPREGETRPRLRFPEFRDAPEWELKSLRTPGLRHGDLFQSAGRNEHRRSAFARYGNEHLQNGRSRASTILRRRRIEWSTVCYDEDVLVGIDGDFTTYAWKQVIARYSTRESCRIKFLTTSQRSSIPQLLVLTAASQDVVDLGLHGTTSEPHALQMCRDDARSYFRSTAEQQRIAACLSSLDALIAAQSRKLDGLRAHKKGLMQQLFPSPEGV